MSLVDDVDVGVGDAPDDELLASCRGDELLRRKIEGQLVSTLIEIERRKLYLSDGFRCLASFGRGVHRWDKLEARAAWSVQVVHTRRSHRRPPVGGPPRGRSGASVGSAVRDAAVGQYVELFLDEFLDWAAMLDFADFEEQVRTWRLLVDQDGSDPERAHRERSMKVGMSDHQYAVSVHGPAIDGVTVKTLLARFEQIEWDIDWATTVTVHGADRARPELMPRTSAQRRYDAFQNLLDHVQVPPRRVRPDDLDDDLDDVVDDHEDLAEDGPVTGTPPGTTEQRPATASVVPVVHLIADIDTYLAALDRFFGGDAQRPFPVPFGPKRGRCHSFDGDMVSPRDLVLASLVGQVQFLLTDDRGHTIAMTRKSRFFTGGQRDGALAMATRCGHPGCLVAASCLQVDHDRPHAHGGPTAMDNCGGGACGHHNNWRFTARAMLLRHPDGRLTTHRADGTDIAPPD